MGGCSSENLAAQEQKLSIIASAHWWEHSVFMNVGLSSSWEISYLWVKLPTVSLWGCDPHSCSLSNFVWYVCVCAVWQCSMFCFGLTHSVSLFLLDSSSTFLPSHSPVLPSVLYSSVTLMNDAYCLLLIRDLLWIQECEHGKEKTPLWLSGGAAFMFLVSIWIFGFEQCMRFNHRNIVKRDMWWHIWIKILKTGWMDGWK